MTYTPVRVQRRRVKGWKAPTCGCGCGKPARYVGRPSKWGNPFIIGMWFGASGPQGEWERHIKITDTSVAVAEYRRALDHGHPYYFPYGFEDRVRSELGGHDLMCWCPDGTPCHADVLLELANPKED